MKVLLVGSGGREHALAWRLKQSPRLTQLWVASGNAGTAGIATNLDVSPEDVEGLVATADRLSPDLVVVGPEAPLAQGLADRLLERGVPTFGPVQAAAQLESSKSFARQVMREAGVPGPEFRSFDDESTALEFVRQHRGPVAVKADGLAAGKGVALCHSPEEAAAAVRACMSRREYGQAGERVVIEEMLSGVEVSAFGFTDGQRLSPLVAACDYKRLQDGDQGSNTGGMGSFCPPSFWSETLARQVEQEIMAPVVAALARRGTPYQGILYAGLMLTETGPKVLEFNCRLGDPEAQVVLPLLATDPLAIMLACAQGDLSGTPVQWGDMAYVGVVMASGGYPGKYETGFEISGLEGDTEDAMVFHAGTRLVNEGGRSYVATAGGRVLTVVGRGSSVAEARNAAYRRARGIHFREAWYRSDIGAEGTRELPWAQRAGRSTG